MSKYGSRIWMSDHSYAIEKDSKNESNVKAKGKREKGILKRKERKRRKRRRRNGKSLP